ncbi:MAG TPA: hypothetical protein VN841_27265 [Bryobacteraceae bacterium]|nr:hypothetical protein [Bryobacteraceae bacterium]
MSALTIAFDTIIVGALALSWVALVIHLFFSRDKSGIEHLLDWVKQQNQPAVAGVLLFAIAYFLGSAVSRIAQDFFDDDDLHIQVGNTVFEVVTEDSIRSSVYCGMSDEWFVAVNRYFGNRTLRQDCTHDNKPHQVPTWLFVVQSTDVSEKDVSDKKNAPVKDASARDASDAMPDIKERVLNIFELQETALLLKGQDATERLRQLHDQINVLRGAAFDGLIAFSLCLFGWCATFSPWLRSVLGLAPLGYLLAGSLAFKHHLVDRALSDPPFMEFTLFVLGAAGIGVLWKGAQNEGTSQGTKGMSKERGVNKNLRAGLLLLLLLFVATACLAWWTTEVIYDQQVIYSYYAQSQKGPN